LACVYGIVQNLNAEIHVRSAPGKGTSWEIDFPLHTTPPAPVPHATPAADQRLKEAIILVVEDDPTVREMIEVVLVDNISGLMVASKPSEALHLSPEQASSIDLLLTGVIMPEMNGRALVEQLRLRQPQLLVLFTSGYTLDEILQQGVQVDEGIFLQKPYTPDKLLAKIAEVLRTPTPAYHRIAP
jgi:CheY-like chemotaxis protein